MSWDTVWQREFEDGFPYEETPDQEEAIRDVKVDMERKRPMDRLICGDVGFGKTEVAIRAAFKAVQDGKQVAVLVPTTVLANQHYLTFRDRFSHYPVRVEMLSRFRTPTEQKKTLTDLQKGMVDVIIGTHRLLSGDVVFKDLGLLVIDEEQRFGVAHKEKIKMLKANVDVIAMTATPIPRTLQMSLGGVRDLSLIETPPEDRLPVQTYVLEYEPEMVRDAILKEIQRGGQAFYVHNRVRSISSIAHYLQGLVPEASFRIAHGQMKEDDLEKVMWDFLNKEFDCLVCTTIIESGLDFPNVNTLIVENADWFGLAQLYQLRGRVGRSNRLAYAYFTFTRDKVLTGDLEQEGMLDLVSRFQGSNGIQADLLKCPHHGSAYSICPEFAAAIKPQLVVISVGRNSFGHPDAQTIRFWQEQGARVLRTDEDGHITILTDGANLIMPGT